MEPIRTERLILRRFAPTDVADFLAFRANPEVLRLILEEPFTEAGATTFLGRQAAFDPATQKGYFALAVVRTASNTVIGEIGLFLHSDAENRGDIGWIIHPDYQGRGYATEAAQALLAFCFDGLHLHRVTAGCDSRNTASHRLMERSGMRREGHLRESRFADGAWHDEYLYALLRSEWRAQR